MEISKDGATPFSSAASAVAYGDHSPKSFFSDSSRLDTKNPSPVYLDPSSGKVIRKPEPSIDLPLPPLSFGDRRKQFVGIRINEGAPLANEISDSSSFSRDGGSELKCRSDNSSNISYAECLPLLPSSARLRSCDVYIGLPNLKPALVRFAKWLRAELELQGVSCFAADRSRCKDAVGHSIVERAMNSSTFGVVIVTKKSFSNPYSIYELRNFLGKKNLVPIFFGLCPGDCQVWDIIEKRGELWEKHGGELWKEYGGTEKEWKEAVNGLLRMEGWKLETHSGNWRDCISEAVLLLGTRLGRGWVRERVKSWKERVEKEEFPFPRADHFVGRKKELLELELMLFGDVKGDGESECFELKTSHRRKCLVRGKRSKSKASVEKGAKEQEERRRKGKETEVWKESEEKIEMEGGGSPKRYLRRGISEGRQRRGKKSAKVEYGKGIACVSGERGIGKTELLLEFAYRFAQRYRRVLWVGGEARYIRQNYMNLFPPFEVDLSIQNQICLERDRPRSFDELEEEAIRRVKKEFMRDIPFLIVIDNLENEKDWWDARNIMELLPRFGGESHVIISTRLPRIMNLEPLRLSYLSGMEAMSLMKGRLKDLSMSEVDALRDIGEKLGRLTFGLALVRGILSELQSNAHGLLYAINKIPSKDLTWSTGEDQLLRRNPFLMRLIDVCFLLFDHVDEVASKMALASGWFAPSPIPVSILALASSEAVKGHRRSNLWKKCLNVITFQCTFSKDKRSEMELSNMLVRTGLAKSTTKHGCICFHEIIQLYARKRGGIGVAHAMFRAINTIKSHDEHSEHIWAVCFILFKFGTDQAIIKPKVSELVSFTKRLVIPLAEHTFNNYSRCNAALELLRGCTGALEAVEESFVSKMDKEVEKSSNWRITSPFLYREVALLKATLLETRAELMLKAGEYEIGEQLYETAKQIQEVFNGWDEHKPKSHCDTIDKLLIPQATSQYN